MDEMDFDSFLAGDMLSLGDACDCCDALLEGMEYTDKLKSKEHRNKGDVKHG